MPGALASFLVGLLFAAGLMVSRMIDPAKVLGFLDVLGNWDPSLAIVMATAVPVAALGFAAARRRSAPVLAPEFNLPSATAIDRRLVLGSALFGVGWGLVGYCPGPALASLLLGRPEAAIFVVAMLAGMAAFALRERRQARGTGLDLPAAGSRISGGNPIVSQE
jgi:uncharacterized protein